MKAFTPSLLLIDIHREKAYIIHFSAKNTITEFSAKRKGNNWFPFEVVEIVSRRAGMGFFSFGSIFHTPSIFHGHFGTQLFSTDRLNERSHKYWMRVTQYMLPCYIYTVLIWSFSSYKMNISVGALRAIGIFQLVIDKNQILILSIMTKLAFLLLVAIVLLLGLMIIVACQNRIF